mmetsp:Transcript_16647/g.35212  ORF Transcript_16647/g.35212 Transcript_16647/m.35212 type:complete len:243 (+) Transcript_16647:503-1231(+)
MEVVHDTGSILVRHHVNKGVAQTRPPLEVHRQVDEIVSALETVRVQQNEQVVARVVVGQIPEHHRGLLVLRQLLARGNAAANICSSADTTPRGLGLRFALAAPSIWNSTAMVGPRPLRAGARAILQVGTPRVRALFHTRGHASLDLVGILLEELVLALQKLGLHFGPLDLVLRGLHARMRTPRRGCATLPGPHGRVLHVARHPSLHLGIPSFPLAEGIALRPSILRLEIVVKLLLPLDGVGY